MHDLRGWMDEGHRPRQGDSLLLAQPRGSLAQSSVVRPVRSSGGNAAASYGLKAAGDGLTASAKGSAAFNEEFAKWAGLIEAAANDISMPRDRRMAAIVGLKQQQQIAAQTARKRAVQEERQKAKAYRRDAQNRRAEAPPPKHN